MHRESKNGPRPNLETRPTQTRKRVEEVTRHVGSSAPKTRHASSSPQLDRFSLTGAGTNTFTSPVRRSSENARASTRNHYISSPRCHHADKINRHPDIFIDFVTLETLDTHSKKPTPFPRIRHLTGDLSSTGVTPSAVTANNQTKKTTERT